MELWGPCYALNPMAIDCMDYNEYGRRYCGARINDRGQWEFKHSSNEAELKTKLQKNFMHVVKESELSHPERRRSMLFINEEVRTTFMKEWEKNNLSTIKLSSMSENQSVGTRAHHRKEIGLRKVRWVVNYIRERLKEKRESILVFAWHREVCEALSLCLEEFKPEIIYGGVSNDTREKAFRAFQSGNRRLLIGNIQALGRGHNLQRADRIIFAEYSWSDELNKQCEKRSSRRGNNKSYIRCEYIVAPDSMDEIILKSLFTKASRVKKIVG
jgi:SWI/SNF-related matrix-associated actin-dependent regulator of chromatin subfamily A-like protein 1